MRHLAQGLSSKWLFRCRGLLTPYHQHPPLVEAYPRPAESVVRCPGYDDRLNRSPTLCVERQILRVEPAKRRVPQRVIVWQFGEVHHFGFRSFMILHARFMKRQKSQHVIAPHMPKIIIRRSFIREGASEGEWIGRSLEKAHCRKIRLRGGISRYE